MECDENIAVKTGRDIKEIVADRQDVTIKLINLSCATAQNFNTSLFT